MGNSSPLRRLLLLPLFILGACYGGCPTYDPTIVPIESGTYTGPLIQGFHTVRKRIVIEREAGIATITFQRDGKQVVETWKLTMGTQR